MLNRKIHVSTIPMPYAKTHTKTSSSKNWAALAAQICKMETALATSRENHQYGKPQLDDTIHTAVFCQKMRDALKLKEMALLSQSKCLGKSLCNARAEVDDCEAIMLILATDCESYRVSEKPIPPEVNEQHLAGVALYEAARDEKNLQEERYKELAKQIAELQEEISAYGINLRSTSST